MTTTTKRKKSSPALKRRKSKKDKSPTRAELRRILGVTPPPPKPKINRKKFVLEIADRWHEVKMTPIEISHYFSFIGTFVLARTKAKAKSKPSIFDDHRITDEELGVLKFLRAICDYHDHQHEIKTYDDIEAIIKGEFVPKEKGGEHNGQAQEQACSDRADQRSTSS